MDARLKTSATLLAIALACSAVAGPLFAMPALGAPAQSREIDALESNVEARAAEVVSARARLAAAEASAAASADRLDALVERQQRLQRQLAARAGYLYRSGPLGFFAVLTSSNTLEEFSARWDRLSRIASGDAEALRDIKATRVQVARSAEALAEQQRALSAELRAVQAAEARARRELAGSKARYAAYLARVEAARAARTAPQAAAAPKSSAMQRRRGTGEWRTAVASHYGKGSWGRKTASGARIGPDSMLVAHKTLPFGTLVEFEYKGRRAVASVEDRGPYTPGRDFDLGPGVINVLDFNGVHTVRYRIIGR